MTMVFRLQEKINIDSLKSGDKVLFHVEKLDGGYTITELQLAP
jgi:Cu/Ag efflux protein CusF